MEPPPIPMRSTKHACQPLTRDFPSQSPRNLKTNITKTPNLRRLLKANITKTNSESTSSPKNKYYKKQTPNPHNNTQKAQTYHEKRYKPQKIRNIPRKK